MTPADRSTNVWTFEPPGELTNRERLRQSANRASSPEQSVRDRVDVLYAKCANPDPRRDVFFGQHILRSGMSDQWISEARWPKRENALLICFRPIRAPCQCRNSD